MDIWDSVDKRIEGYQSTIDDLKAENKRLQDDTYRAGLEEALKICDIMEEGGWPYEWCYPKYDTPGAVIRKLMEHQS